MTEPEHRGGEQPDNGGEVHDRRNNGAASRGHATRRRALAGDAERGTKTTDGLSLLFTTAGITVQGPQPQIERLLVWSGLDSASCREKIVLPDGRNAAVMELTSGGQSIRFLLPLDTVTPGQAAYLDQALPAWLSRYKGAATAASPPNACPLHSGFRSTGAPAQGTPPWNRRPPEGAPPSPEGSSPAPGTTAAPARTAYAPTAAGTRRIGLGPPTAAHPRIHPPPPAPQPHPPHRATPAGRTTGSPTSARQPHQPPAHQPLRRRRPRPRPRLDAPWVGPHGPASSAGNRWLDGSSDPLPPVWPGAPRPGERPAIAPEAPTKKTRGWRKDRTLAIAHRRRRRCRRYRPPHGAVSPLAPPSEPPVDPVPLPSTRRCPLRRRSRPSPPVRWCGSPDRPGNRSGALDQTTTLDSIPPPAKARGWRKRRKAAAGAARHGGARPPPPPGQPPHVEPRPRPGQPPPERTRLLHPARSVQSAAQAGRKSSRATLAVLLIVLVVVVGGVAYFVVKRNDNRRRRPAIAVTAPTPSPTALDSALAASINLRLTDLPSRLGADHHRPDSQPRRLRPAQARASQALAACLGPTPRRGGRPVRPGRAAGQTARSDRRPSEDGTDPGIQMVSQSTVMQTPADAQSLTAPFANPNFVTCFGQFQSSLVAAAVPGSTAQVRRCRYRPPRG